MRGRYPQDVMDFFKSKGVVLPDISTDDLRTINQGLDYLGLNYYYSEIFNNGPGRHWPYETTHPENEEQKFHLNKFHPDGLFDLLTWMDREYKLPLRVTGNGRNLNDRIDAAGRIEDDERIEYIYQHLAACRRAIDKGVNLTGFIVWAFLDNLEWNHWSRMGLVYTDFKTQKRTIKKSGRWFRDGIKNGFRFPA